MLCRVQHRYFCIVTALLSAVLAPIAPQLAIADDTADAEVDTAVAEREATQPESDAPVVKGVLNEFPSFLDIPEITASGDASLPLDREKIISLTGRTILRITAENPPAGFDPAADAAVPLGIPFHAGLVRAAVMRLFETGRYRDVQIGVRPIDEKQVELVISVLPMLRVRKLTIRGNNAMKNDDVARVIEYTSGRTIQPDPEVLRVLRQKLLDRYAELGYREAQSALTILTTAEPGGVELSVNVTEGDPDRFTSVIIRGLPDDVPPSVVGITKGLIRNRDKMNKLEQELLAGLAEYGYFDATVLPIQERRTGRYSLELTLTTEPGMRSLISFHGNRHFLSSDLNELIESDGPLRTDPEALMRKAARIKKHLLSHGFLFADVTFVRKCVSKGHTMQVQEGTRCAPSDDLQQIEFLIDEGKVVDVVNVFFSGNDHFTDQVLEDELFAFISEKNKSDDLFQPITTDTLNTLGVSDKLSDNHIEDSDFKAPRFRRQRVYVPEQYADGANHLVGVFQEQGYLSATVVDTCDIEARQALQ